MDTDIKKVEKDEMYRTDRFILAQESLKIIEKKISPYTSRKKMIYIPPTSEWWDEPCIDNNFFWVERLPENKK